jgi:general secretion pathway protein G
MSHDKSATHSTPATAERKGGRNARHNAGFTLVELIIVMAILGLLAGLSIPAFAKIKDKAREVRAMEEIRGLEKGITAYAIERNEVLPNQLSDLQISIPLDPWGNSYVYHKITGPADGQARIDIATAQLNTDYDLYSMGPDGATARGTDAPTSRDDVVRTGNGGYVGRAAYP